MKHLELHIIQSVPVACLNRDDLNSPKTAIFGGVQRARVSSQAWKRAVRELMQEMDIAMFKENPDKRMIRGNRSRRMVSELSTRLEKKGMTKDVAVIISEHIADIIETLDSKTDTHGYRKIKTLMFFSDQEYEALVNGVTDDIKTSASKMKDWADAIGSSTEDLKKLEDEAKKKTAAKEKERLERELEKERKTLAKAFNDRVIRDTIKSVQLKDAADIALFGRMVANDHSLTVEAASMFSHALSTHRADNEIDFFAAVDDLQPKEESGAGMTSTLEFNSATYYRFAALNLDMLADEEHLKSIKKEERQSVVRTFVEATIKAIPGARKNTMNGNTFPSYVLGVVRENGHPVQLVNAFENPVRSSQGYVAKSIELMEAEYKKLADTWGVSAVFKQAIPEVGLNDFLKVMVNHVI
jgi:CRISPR system Cascade subunit CasC